METLKLKGHVDSRGRLHLDEQIALPEGEVEVVIRTTSSKAAATRSKRKSQVKALQGWFEKTKPVPPDFDVDEARWEALKEKYNL